MLLVLFNTVQAQIWARMRRWAQIFARAAYGGAQKHAENDTWTFERLCYVVYTILMFKIIGSF